MKVVVAPDSFKESLGAAEVAAAIAAGVLAVCPDAVVDLCPMADGGEGTVEAMVTATGGRYLTADVFGPLGSPLRARLGLLGSVRQAGLPGELGLTAALGAAHEQADGDAPAAGHAAVVEMAAASGLALVPPDRRDPMRTTTFGTGQLLLAALDAGAEEIIVGIGGSATVDGGAGCAQALGVTFVGRDGSPCVCGLAGGGLKDIARIDISGRDPRIARARIRVASDVTNPLTGPEGAAAVYGPQKGATPEMVADLDAGLANLAEVIRRDLGVDVERMPGAGAAGGLGAGLAAFAGAKIESGVAMIAAAVGLAHRLAGADLCITGEGRLDASSLSGKTAVGVAKMARQAGVPVACIAGQAAPGVGEGLFEHIRPLVAGDVTPAVAMRKAAELLTVRAQELMHTFIR